MPIPPTAEFLKPVLQALEKHGGEASNAEIMEEVVRHLALTEADLATLHNPERGKRTEVAYRLAWARTRLKNDGKIERVRPQVWRLASAVPEDEP